MKGLIIRYRGLFHLSPKKGLTVLEPSIPPYALSWEPNGAFVCFALTWWQAAALLPAKRPDWQKAIKEGEVFLYVPEGRIGNLNLRFLSPEDYPKDLEVRITESVKVQLLGQLDFSNELVRKAFSSPCTVCGRPGNWCNEGWDCGQKPPSLKEVLIKRKETS